MKFNISFHENGGQFQTANPRSLSKTKSVPYYSFEAESDSGGYLGVLNLIYTKWGFWETHAYIVERYHGNGFGIKLYEAAIQHARSKGFQVRSSLDTSEMAKRVWKSKRLRSNFAIKRVRNRYMVH